MQRIIESLESNKVWLTPYVSIRLCDFCSTSLALEIDDFNLQNSSTWKRVKRPKSNMKLKSLLVPKTRGNHPISRELANDIALLKPLRDKVSRSR